MGSAAVNLATTPELKSLQVFKKGAGLALECGAKVKVKAGKKKPQTCPKKKCFAAGTLVHTEDGLVPIEEIKVGDKVKSMDLHTGEIAYKEVTDTHINQFSSTGIVALLDETDGSVTSLSVTPDHPIYSDDRGWIHASKLKLGEKVKEDDGHSLTVTDVTFDPNAPINITYNLSVADNHTYFVGEDGVLAHNGLQPYQIVQKFLVKGFIRDGIRRTPCGCKRDWINPKNWI